MKGTHALETLLVRAIGAGVRAMSWKASLAVGARLGDLVGALGVRRRVAEQNLAIAFPQMGPAERDALLARHYREVGRIVVEYPRLGELVHAPRDRVFGEYNGVEHIWEAAARERGVLLVTGHLGNFELVGASISRMHSTDFIVKPMSNPGVDAWISERRAEAGVGLIPIAATRRVYEALRANRWVAMAADQDARGKGVFVPFFGRPTSTATGPARIALATGAPIVFATCSRLADGRHSASFDAPLWPEGDARDPEAVRALTARHVALLERSVRAHPEEWFWLHRRWKTPPPAAEGDGSRAPL